MLQSIASKQTALGPHLHQREDSVFEPLRHLSITMRISKGELVRAAQQCAEGDALICD